MQQYAFLGTLFSVLFIGATASAHDYNIGNLTIHHPYAVETFESAKTGAGYLSVTNDGETPDRLIEVRSSYPRTTLHQTRMQNGVARMEHVADLEIAPGETVTLEPGGMHIMFMGIDGRPFEIDEKVPATLVFEVAGEIEVLLSVQEREAADSMEDHAEHDRDPDK